MKCVLILITSFIIFYSSKAQVAELYWKDYYGTPPNDALEAGVNRCGLSTYVGQFPISKSPIGDTADIIAATIDSNITEAYGLYNSKVIFSDENVKILCNKGWPYSPHTSIQWSNTFINDCIPFQGGSNSSQTFYVGRTNYKGQNVIGTFSADEMVLNVPWTESEEEEWKPILFTSFEMLFACVKIKIPI